jgi:glycerol-3-phosphate O-acyltransferase
LHIKTSMYFFLRFWDRTFSQVVINREQLLKIKELIDSKQKNVVLLPTHKSFIDMWLLSFIH